MDERNIATHTITWRDMPITIRFERKSRGVSLITAHLQTARRCRSEIARAQLTLFD
jgi:hypothetical protein